MPAHRGVKGNEAADGTAKEAKRDFQWIVSVSRTESRRRHKVKERRQKQCAMVLQHPEEKRRNEKHRKSREQGVISENTEQESVTATEKINDQKSDAGSWSGSETGESYQSMFLTQTRLFGLNLFDFVVDMSVHTPVTHHFAL